MPDVLVREVYRHHPKKFFEIRVDGRRVDSRLRKSLAMAEANRFAAGGTIRFEPNFRLSRCDSNE
jgi:hypothetical protein